MTITSISPASLSDAIALLHREGVSAVLEAFPQLRGHRLQLQLLTEAEQDVTDLDALLARATARVEEAEAALRRAVLEQGAAE